MTTPKQSIQKLKPYNSVKNSTHLFEQSTRIMKLDSNESSLPPSPRVMAALIEFIQKSPLNWYPDLQARKLVDNVSVYTQCRREYIQIFNGADNALETICKTFVEPGDEVVLCMPIYDHFRVYAESCDAHIIPVFGESPFLPKTDKIVEAVTAKTKMVYIVNPNNPTGMIYSRDDIKQILTQAPHALVIVDEVYYEFCGITISSLLHNHRNLVIVRSFSKAFGLAGLRCGYILTHPSNLEPINKVRTGKINSLAQVAACAALDDLEYVERYVFEVKTAKKWLYEKLRSMGLKVINTSINFLLIEAAQPKKVEQFLEKQDIYIRASLPQLEGYMRITIGHQLLMERFWKIFKTIPVELLFGENRAEQSNLA